MTLLHSLIILLDFFSLAALSLMSNAFPQNLLLKIAVISDCCQLFQFCLHIGLNGFTSFRRQRRKAKTIVPPITKQDIDFFSLDLSPCCSILRNPETTRFIDFFVNPPSVASIFLCCHSILGFIYAHHLSTCDAFVYHYNPLKVYVFGKVIG